MIVPIGKMVHYTPSDTEMDALGERIPRVRAATINRVYRLVNGNAVHSLDGYSDPGLTEVDLIADDIGEINKVRWCAAAMEKGTWTEISE